MKVKEIMTKNVISIDKDVDLTQVLNLMKKNDITKIPVVENKKLVGIVTDNIIAYKLGSIRKREISTSRLHASSVMEKNYEAITPLTDVKVILRTIGTPGPTMLPVVDDEKLIGVVTKADLLHLVKSNKSVTSVMRTLVLSVAPDDRVVHARRIMLDNDIARLPVLGKGKLLGMISDREIIFAFANLKNSITLGRQKHQLEELLVSDIMKTPALWIKSDLTVLDAAKVMLKMGVGALPVLKEDDVIGIISRTDVLKTLSI